MMISRCTRLLARTALPLLLCCSSISTAYYARPEDAFLSAEKCPTGRIEGDLIPCARLKIEGVEIIYWAVTDYHTTMRGPCLIPLYLVDAPILESFDLSLRWRIILPPELRKDPPVVFILPDSILATVDSSRTDRPTNMTMYRFENGLDGIEKNWSFYQDYEPVPASIPLSTDKTLEIRYNTIFYWNVKSFSVQPGFRIHGREVKGPRIGFAPATDRKYTACEFPFMIPVR